MTVLAVFRPPFEVKPVVARLPEGLTLTELAGQMPGLPADFSLFGVICVSGRPVPRQSWHLVRPKPWANGGPVEITFHATPRGGEGGGGKKIFALIASIALTALTGSILAGRFATAGGLFAKGTLSATFLSVGVSLAGSLLLSALTAPPTGGQQPRPRPNEGAASAQGNALDPNGAIPRVMGNRKIYPPLACEPLTYFDGPDEVVEAIYCLAGPHRLTDIRIGAADPASLQAVEIETREGWPGDTRLRLVRRQGRTESVQAELSGHIVDQDNGAGLDRFTDVANTVPRPQVVATRNSPDEHWLHLIFSQGLHYQGNESVRLRVPLRLRIRAKGATDWINLPELHFQAASLRQLRASIKLIWTDRAADPQAASGEGWVEARRSAPSQTQEPETGGFSAHVSFGASGPVWMDAGNLGSTGVQRVEMDRHEARILLNPADFPPGRYEVEVTRGVAITQSSWSAAGYTVSGSVWNLFGYRGSASPTIARSRDGTADSLYLLRSVSIRNAPPVPGDGLALIAVRARNRQLEQVSVVAGGYVPDWNGSSWSDWTVTSNPAPHLRHVLAGSLNARPVPEDLLDDAEILAWRADCAAKGFVCNHLSEDESVLEAAQVLASCGYASLRMSETWGIVRDRDRSTEAPVQIFTPRNSRGLRFERALPDLPDGFRVTFPDASDDYLPRQIDVPRPGGSLPLSVPEMITYQGITTEAAARARARFDLLQAELRSTFWSLTAPAEAIVARRGDLVGVSHDMLSRWMGSGRIAGVRVNGSGLATHLVLDAAVDLTNEPEVFSVPDLFAVPDIFALGSPSGVVVRSNDGPGDVLLLTNATGSSNELALSVPQDPSPFYRGALVAVGLASTVVRRLIFFGSTPAEDLTAEITMIDEAQELFA
ncbi:MAG: phage tail protein [Paracoccaceae bacterium]